MHVRDEGIGDASVIDEKPVKLVLEKDVPQHIVADRDVQHGSCRAVHVPNVVVCIQYVCRGRKRPQNSLRRGREVCARVAPRGRYRDAAEAKEVGGLGIVQSQAIDSRTCADTLVARPTSNWPYQPTLMPANSPYVLSPQSRRTAALDRQIRFSRRDARTTAAKKHSQFLAVNR